MTTALDWLKSAVGTLPGWLATSCALLVGALVLVIVVRLFSKIIFRVIGLLISIGLGLVAHLMLRPAFTWLLEHYTAWRGTT